MDVKTIEDLYRYNRWANSRVLDSVSTLTRDQFVSTIPSSYPSVRETLVHVLRGEWLWLRRWKGASPTKAFNQHDFPDASALRSRWTEVQTEEVDFLRSLTVDRLSTVVRYVNIDGQPWEYPLWKQMVHVVNHSSYHRGQAATLLRQLGVKPPPTDFLVFYDETVE